jgi:hypothetical protein
MATIVTFVPRVTGARHPLPSGSTGSVVFFTGVRYEKPENTTAGRDDLAAAARNEPAAISAPN